MPNGKFPTNMERSVAEYTKYAAKYALQYADSVLDIYKEFSSFLVPGGKVLDAGCGPGRDLKRFVDDGFQATGVDLNKRFAQMASAFSGAPVHLSDIRKMPFDDNEFDAVWACASLVHMRDVELVSAIKEIRRVAKPGAWVFLSVKTYVNDVDQSGWYDTKFGKRWFQYWGSEAFPLTLDHFRYNVSEYFIDNGFINVYAKIR